MDFITVVSGLPRSGTSMMMRMLQAGGLEILTDNVREPDDDNPRGYFELEKVKKVKEDTSWLNSASGKAFKMVSQLLYDLPPDRQYRIILMKRKMQEILASQKKMLENSGKDAGGAGEGKMSLLFQKHLAVIESWVKKQNNIRTLFVNYNDVIANPFQEAQRINEFLELHLDLTKMVEVVEPALYRQRK